MLKREKSLKISRGCDGFFLGETKKKGILRRRQKGYKLKEYLRKGKDLKNEESCLISAHLWLKL